MPRVIAVLHVERSQDVAWVVDEIRLAILGKKLPARLEVNHVEMKTHKAKADTLTKEVRKEEVPMGDA